MFDVHEYMLSIQEQDKAILGLADSINEIVHCMKFGESKPGEMNRALADMIAYRSVYIALVNHAHNLLQ